LELSATLNEKLFDRGAESILLKKDLGIKEIGTHTKMPTIFTERSDDKGSTLMAFPRENSDLQHLEKIMSK